MLPSERTNFPSPSRPPPPPSHGRPTHPDQPEPRSPHQAAARSGRGRTGAARAPGPPPTAPAGRAWACAARAPRPRHSPAGRRTGNPSRRASAARRGRIRASRRVRRWEERGVCVIACSPSPPRGPLCAHPRPTTTPNSTPLSPTSPPPGRVSHPAPLWAAPSHAPPRPAPSHAPLPAPSSQVARPCAGSVPCVAGRCFGPPCRVPFVGCSGSFGGRGSYAPRAVSSLDRATRRATRLARHAGPPEDGLCGDVGTAVKQGQNGAADGVWRTRWRHSAMISSHRAGV